MEKNALWVILALVVLVVALFIFPVFDFSVVGQMTEKELIFSEVFGGTSIIEVTIPENKTLIDYRINIRGEEYAHPAILGEQLVEYSDIAGPFIDEDFDDDQVDEIFMYLYKIPESWGEIDVLHAESQMKATINLNSPGQEGVAELYHGATLIEYPYDSVRRCNSADSDRCIEDYIVRTFSNRNREMSVTHNDITFRFRERDYFKAKFSDSPGVNTGTAVSEAKFAVNLEEQGFVLRVRAAEYSGASVSFEEPTTKISYQRSYFPTDLTYSVVSANAREYTITGEFNDQTTTANIAEDINEYCGRNEGETDECTAEIAFSSKSAGKLYVESDQAQISTILTDDNDERRDNIISGLVTDIRNNQGTAIIGSVIVIVLVLLAVLIQRRIKSR